MAADNSANVYKPRSRRRVIASFLAFACVAGASAACGKYVSDGNGKPSASPTASPTPSGKAGGQEVSVGTCSPANAGKGIIANGKPYELTQAATTYGVTMKDAAGHILRFLPLARTFPQQSASVNLGHAVTYV